MTRSRGTQADTIETKMRSVAYATTPSSDLDCLFRVLRSLPCIQISNIMLHYTVNYKGKILHQF